MKGDFSRDTFDRVKHFSRVLMQQGRVQLDADWNEQTAILLHYLQALAADLIGPHGGPGDSFKIDTRKDDKGASITIKNDFSIQAGHYYVHGILCENEELVAYTHQLDYPGAVALEVSKTYLVYLDVWERHLSYIEVESPDDRMISIREVALGGPDTATRAQIVWQVKVENKLPPSTNTITKNEVIGDKWKDWVALWQPTNRGMLKAQAKKEQKKDAEPCITSPEAHYRGAENQLYRVEIHKGGMVGTATFKWSRENGSVILAVKQIETGAQPNTTKVTLTSPGSGCEISLAVGNWVEIVDDNAVLKNETKSLLKVVAIDQIDRTATLEGVSEGIDMSKHPLLRRWDFKLSKEPNAPVQQANDKALPINEDQWLTLENGIQIWFGKAVSGSPPHNYRTGDYWLIPARTATGDVEWLGSVGKPTALPPHGVVHHYAPLAIITLDGDGNIKEPIEHCRSTFGTLAK